MKPMHQIFLGENTLLSNMNIAMCVKYIIINLLGIIWNLEVMFFTNQW